MLNANELTFGVFSKGLFDVPCLQAFLDARALRFRPATAEGVDVVLGWGNRPTAARAEAFAKRHDRPFWRLEDGFLRSVGIGAGCPALSLVVDDLGIYYDASGPSRLEALLNAAPGDDPLADAALLARSQGLVERVRHGRISKYNNASDRIPTSLERVPGEVVLVVDQTVGDVSIPGGLVPTDGFVRMLETALARHPLATVVVKSHPDVLRGKKRGYLTRAAKSASRVILLVEHMNPLALVERASHVYTCSSQLGFEALVVGKPVTCFGAPFYSGWGLTEDMMPVPRRTRRRNLTELAAAAWLLYPRYVDPVRGGRCEAETVLGHLELQRQMFAENAGQVRALGFSRWKRGYAHSYLASPDAQVKFVRGHAAVKDLAPPTRLVVWGRRAPATLLEQCKQLGVAVAFMEDGFLRSVGLGSDLTAPSSLVVDHRGLYYDPSVPSDLEFLLQNAQFSATELVRARLLRELLVKAQLSKYNGPLLGKLTPQNKPGQRVLLVPGQVEDDGSVQLGGAGLFDNGALLAAVRAKNPDAYLVYKPHPDVVSGNRPGALTQLDARHADQLESEVPLPLCLQAVDEVHTLTSLVGFEALLRGLPVHTYGQPFYAGYGLTTDRVPVPRRTRRLLLDELVAGALLRYPRYYSYRAGAFVTAEDTVWELIQARERSKPLPPRSPRLRRQLYRALRAVLEVLRAG